MWLTLDIGNSALKGGLFDGEQIDRVFHVKLTPTLRESADAWAEQFADLVNTAAVERVGVASVVPAVTALVCDGLRAATAAPVLHIDSTCRLPLTLDYATPGTLGTDRLAAAVAAWVYYGAAPKAEDMQHVIAVDAGTAVTCEVVTRPGIYRGGTIAPGPALMQRALHAGTAQLPEVPLALPDTLIGESTQKALQAGMMYGTIDSVRGLLHRFRAKLDAPPAVVLTGGWSGLLHPHLDRVDAVDPHLVLRGIQTLMTLNPGR